MTTVHPSKPLESSPFGFSCPGEGGCPGGPGGFLSFILDCESGEGFKG